MEKDVTVNEKMINTFSFSLQNLLVRHREIAKPNIEVKYVKIRRI